MPRRFTGAPRLIPSLTIACATGHPAGRAQPWRPNDRQTTSKIDGTAVRGAGRHLRVDLHGHPAGRDDRDVVHQLVAHHATEVHRTDELPTAVRRQAVLGLARL